LFLNCELGNQLTSAQWSLFPLWQLENLEIEAFCKHHRAMAVPVRQSLHNLQRCRAFIAAFTREKTMDDNQKMFIPQLPIDTKFFHCAFVNPCTM
jgi:hypothetical protein